MKGARFTTLLFCLLASTATFSASVASNDVTTRGYLKSWAIWTDSLPDQGLLPIPVDGWWSSQTAARIMLDWFPSSAPDTAFQLHYEIQPVFDSDSFAINSTTPLGFFSPSEDRYRLTSPDPILAENGKKSRIYQNLDRLNMRYSMENSDLTIGRQAVALGTARAINPVDIFVPYSITTLNQEYRQGVDAIRYQYALGAFSELDTGLITGHHGRDNGAWVRLLFPALDYDFSVIAARANEDWLFGGGMQGSLGESGIWLEASQLRGRTDTSNRYSAGIDRSLSADVFVQLEYHYSSAGSNDPADYLQLLASAPWQEHGYFLLGREYLVPVINWQVSPLVSTSFQALYNLGDHSWFFNGTAEFSLSDNLYASAGSYIFYGNPLEQNSPLAIMPHSEFGSSPNSVFGSLRYYF